MSHSSRGDFLAVTLGGPSDYAAKQRKDDGKPREVRLYSFPDLKGAGKIESDQFISSAVLSPDGKLLAGVRQTDGSRQREIVIWDVLSRKLKHTFALTVHRGATLEPTVRFSPDSKRLAYSDLFQAPKGFKDSRTGLIVIREFDADSGKPLDVTAHEANQPDRTPLRVFQFLPDGKHVMVHSRNLIRIYQLGTGKYRTVFQHQGQDQIRHALVSADGNWLVLGIDAALMRGGDPITPSIVIWDLQNNKIHDTWTLPGIGKGIGSLALSADKKKLAVGASGLYLFDISVK